MKTPLPEPAIWQERWRRNESGEIIAHEAPFTAFTESQLRAAMVAVWNEAIEEAALVCRDMKQECGEPDSMQACLNRQMMSCSDAILKLKETP